MNLTNFMTTHQRRVNCALENCLPGLQSEPQQLHAAMHYAVLNGGKRIRPLLVYASGEISAASLEDLDRIACVIELIHAYSLVHDDLPAMDDDDFRRGQPSCHKAFGEATAILVGDALQSLAFQLLAEPQATAIDARTRLQMVTILAQCTGSYGMAGGQLLDLQAQQQQLTLEQLQHINALKTGALIRASILLGSLVGTADAQQQSQLAEFASHVGLAFQIQDDILDCEDTDNIPSKSTYPAMVGLEKAKLKINELHNKALSCLKNFGNKANSLINLVNAIMQRIY